MSISFNGTELLVGTPQYYGTTQLDEIVFNGVSVWHYDEVKPVITITSAIGDWTASASYTITGTVTDEASGVASVKVNGTVVTLTNNAFSKVLTLSDGDNTITITATDNAGNTETKTVHKYYDKTAPTLTITSATQQWTGASMYTLTGTVSDSQSGIGTVTINGTAVTVSSGAFSKTIGNLEDGQNDFEVIATDAVGNSTSEMVYVLYDKTAPTITITSDIGDWTANESYTIRGYLNDEQSGNKNVKVNGTIVPFENNSAFSKALTLSSGDNTITVKAEDNVGNTRTKTVHKYYDTAAPQLSITSASGKMVSSSYTLTGTVSDYQSGVASVTVNGSAVSVSGGSFSKSFTGISGTYTITVVATDNVGRSTTKSVTVNNVNEKNDANSNWSTTQRIVDSNNVICYQIKNGSSWYNAQIRSEYNSSGQQWDETWISGSIGVWLPHGLSSFNIPVGWYGASSNGHGYLTEVWVKDYTTNEVLYNNTLPDASGGSGSVNVSLQLTSEQATHNLYLYAEGYAWGREYDGTAASLGLGITWSGFSPNWTFNWY